jgi:hypothetical protein
MPRGDASHRSPEEPRASVETDIAAGHSALTGTARPADGPPGSWASRPGRSRAKQQEILAQFEAAIAGMHTREIQIGLRQLLGGLDSPPGAGTREGPEITRNGAAAGTGGIAGSGGVEGPGEVAEVDGAAADRAEAGGGPGAAGAGAAGKLGANGSRRNGQPGVGGWFGTYGQVETDGASANGDATVNGQPGVGGQVGPTGELGANEARVAGVLGVNRDRVTGQAGANGGGVSGERGAGELDSDAGWGARPPGALPGRRPWLDLDGVPQVVAELVRSVRTPSARRQLERLVGEAELRQPVTIDLDTAARMVRPYRWLLGRVGHEGIRLTDAGHLPPDEVAAVIGTLGLGAGRPARAGSSVKRENQAPAVVQLRESAQATGLVRKERGRLLRTAVGDELQSDPAGLWWHLAARVPLRSAAVSEVQPGLILLACVAARFTETLDVTIARMLTAIGWGHRDGSPLTGHEAARATSGTHAVLRRVGALPGDRRSGPGPGPTPEGVAFARAALRTWPAG